MTIKNWNIEEMTGYKPITTYYEDFGIAEQSGEQGIKDTFNRATSKDGYASSDFKVMTEFVMALNWKMWEHESNRKLCKLYYDLWAKAEQIVEKTFTPEQLQYYYHTTD